MRPELDDDTLQRYYDGELSPVEERTVRAAVESDPNAQQRLAQLARLSEMFQAAADEMAMGLDSNKLFSNIQSDIRTNEGLGFGERFQVIRSEWMEHQRAVVISLTTGAAIAAAALVAVIAEAPGTSGTQVAVTPAREPAESATSPAALAANEAPDVHGSAIENVDFGGSTGTVFEIESKGITTAVVWIDDEEEEAP
jgi:hypothetical protein